MADHVTPPPPVVVLFGGPSAEHDVSIVSGTAIADALESIGYPVAQVLIDLGGRWWWLPSDHRRGERSPADYDNPLAMGAAGPLPVGAALDRLAAARPAPVLALALHGPFGEDGTVQALLEAAGLAYTGSGVAASAIGMDKTLFKRLCRGLGLPLVDWREIRAQRWAEDPAGVRLELGAFASGAADPRLMVKPARLGSSVGMTLVHDSSEIDGALEAAFRHDSLVLAETYLADARDLEVSVIGNDPARLELYGPGEIVSGHEFYDYAAKYSVGVSRTMLKADMTDRQRATVLKIARDAYRAVGAEGFARVDFLLAGTSLYLSEINTIPGFTPISLFPALAAQGGRTFADVCSRIVGLALERHDARAGRRLAPEHLPR